jgi:hypothetical protein
LRSNRVGTSVHDPSVDGDLAVSTDHDPEPDLVGDECLEQQAAVF